MRGEGDWEAFLRVGWWSFCRKEETVVTPLPMPIARPMWLLASFQVTLADLRNQLGQPHYIETDPRATCGLPEDWWAFALPSGQRTMISLEDNGSGFCHAGIYGDPPELEPILAALSLSVDDSRIRRCPEPILM